MISSGANVLGVVCVALTAALAVAGRRLTLAARARRRAEEALRLRDRLNEIFHALPGDDMYAEVLRVVLEAMGSDDGVLARVEEDGALSASGPFAFPPGHLSLPHALEVPLRHHGATIGLLLVCGRAAPYGQRDRARLDELARALAAPLCAAREAGRHERERRAAEDALRASERELREAQRVGCLGSWSWDARTDRIVWSEENYRIYGLDPARPPPGYREHLRLYTPESAARLDAAVQRNMTAGEPYEIDLELGPDCPTRWITARSETRRDEHGAIVGLRGTAHDITARKRAEDALRSSEERYRRIVETAHEGIWMVDPDARTTFVNRQMAEMLGRTVEELRGASLLDVLDEEGRRLAAEALRRRERGVSEQHELRFRRRDGTELRALVATTPIRDERGAYAGALKMVTDITEWRRAEEQLRQVQKLEAVGRLAGGVAHDFNNLLTAILGEVQLLVEGLAESDPLLEEALEIEAAARKAALLTRQLLAFGRQQSVAPRVVGLSEVIASADRMLRRLIGEDVELISVTEPGLGAVRVDAVQLEQVLLNLAVNARDAMPGGGRLTIEGTNLEIDDAEARRLGGMAPGRYVLLAVHDTGAGMSAEVQAHLFEPFFTTKEPGKGTGLGLATVYGIVKQAGGEVRVDSAPGQGTSFEIYLPRAEGTPERAPAPVRAAAPRGTETILVVEDEPKVRVLAARTLRRAGYTVLETGDPEAALGIVAAPGQKLDLLVTDVVMPRLSGPELAARVRASRPELAVLFSSGYTDRTPEVEAQIGLRTAFLAKPFVPTELARAVRELLDGAAPARAPGAVEPAGEAAPERRGGGARERGGDGEQAAS